MNVAIYKGASALNAMDRWQESIAQNLAYSAVPGYRRDQMTFSGVLGNVSKLKDNDKVTKTLKGVIPESHRAIDVTPAGNSYTGVETNFAIDGNGFFRVRKPDGTFGYTRSGDFHMNQDRILVDMNGYTVEGDNGPIQFRQEGGTIFINSEGTIVQGDQQLSKMAVYNFKQPENMRRMGDGLLSPAPGDAAVPLERPAIMHMCLEASNVKPMNEMISMVTVGRAYEAAKKVIDVADDANAKAIQYLGGNGQ